MKAKKEDRKGNKKKRHKKRCKKKNRHPLVISIWFRYIPKIDSYQESEISRFNDREKRIQLESSPLTLEN